MPVKSVQVHYKYMSFKDMISTCIYYSVSQCIFIMYLDVFYDVFECMYTVFECILNVRVVYLNVRVTF